MTFGRRVLVGGFLGAGAESGIFAPACAYLRIRRWRRRRRRPPSSARVCASASAIRSRRCARSPRAAAVNVVGDLPLIGPCGLGLSGAAAATALANYAAAAMVVGPLWRRYRPRWRRPRYADLRRFAAVSGALLAGDELRLAHLRRDAARGLGRRHARGRPPDRALAVVA